MTARTERDEQTIDVENVAQAILSLSGKMGLRYLFLTGGTDLAPIQDALARFEVEHGTQTEIIPVNVPHETVSTAMALGYAMYTGKPAAVAVHVHVGTSNSLGNLMNARRSRVPMLLLSGKTPKTEFGHLGSRDYWIHWGQDVYDQSGIVREFVKWDYEITRKENLPEVIARAFRISQSDPPGPVYLTFGREILMERITRLSPPDYRLSKPTELSVVSQDLIRNIGDAILSSENPLVIAGAMGRNANSQKLLLNLCRSFAIGVSETVRTYNNYPTTDYCHLGFDANSLVQDSDLILVLDCIVPWVPSVGKPREGAKIILVDQDPSFREVPMWSFPLDVAISCDSYIFLSQLNQFLNQKSKSLNSGDRKRLENRKASLQGRHDAWRRGAKRFARAHSKDKPIDMSWLAYCVNDALQRENDFIVVNEYSLDQNQMEITKPRSYYGQVAAGYLGRGLGQALGLKIASPNSLVAACLGDGSYIFSVPEAAHWVSQSYHLPFLTVILNNQGWAAERKPIDQLYPKGWSATHSKYVGVYLDPPGQYSKIVEAFGGYGEQVEDPDEISSALERAISCIKKNKKQAVLDVVCKKA